MCENGDSYFMEGLSWDFPAEIFRSKDVTTMWENHGPHFWAFNYLDKNSDKLVRQRLMWFNDCVDNCFEFIVEISQGVQVIFKWNNLAAIKQLMMIDSQINFSIVKFNSNSVLFTKVTK